MLGVAGWISPQEREKGISSQICLEYWDGDPDLNLLIAERVCVYLTFKKNMDLSAQRFIKMNVSLYIHNKNVKRIFRSSALTYCETLCMELYLCTPYVLVSSSLLGALMGSIIIM